MNGKPPQCAIVVKVDTILADLTDSAIDGKKYDEELFARQQATLY